MNSPDFSTFTCPVGLSDEPVILLGHGGGGKMTQRLLDKIFMPAFSNPLSADRHDCAELRIGKTRSAFTTDSFVVRPIFFPGGDIGKLAVYGTANDLAMRGARPRFLSAGFIIEEGFAFDTLTKIVSSMAEALQQTDMQLVTGDTKVVEKGKGDGIFINTSGIGIIEHDLVISPTQVRSGDIVILSGDIGRHGIAVLAMREGLEFSVPIVSDCAPLFAPIQKLIAEGIEVHCLRDLTRGGLAAALVEIAQSSRSTMEITESVIPVEESVKGACEILGLDPMHIANEGRFIAFVPENQCDRALAILAHTTSGVEPKIIGKVTGNADPMVTLTTQIGTKRIMDLPSGELLPRIC